MLQKAIRPKVKLKVILYGVSGSGKTYSALRLAKGIGGQVALINTEGERGLLYADKFDYMISTLDNNSPGAYVRAIDECIEAGVNVVIIDSISHEWEYCLDKVSQKGGSFFGWKDVTPRHNEFMQKIALAPIHIISTARAKTKYSITEDDKGKKNIEKIGAGMTQKDSVEYEYMLSLLIDTDHKASVSKDNTGVFYDGHEVQLDEDIGQKLLARSEKGKAFEISQQLTASAKIDKAIYNAGQDTGYAVDEETKTMCRKLQAMGDGIIEYKEHIGSAPPELFTADKKKFILSFINYVADYFQLGDSEASQPETQAEVGETNGGQDISGSVQQTNNDGQGSSEALQSEGQREPTLHKEGMTQTEIPFGG